MAGGPGAGRVLRQPPVTDSELPVGPPPGVELTVAVSWCAEHLEPYRARWPQGYMPATTVLFDTFVRLDNVQAYCQGKGGALNAALAEFGPMCCRVAEATISGPTGELAEGLTGADLLAALTDAATNGDLEMVASLRAIVLGLG